MRLLVLGGSGYLGAHVVRHALERGMDVTTAGRGEGGPAAPHERLDLGAVDAATVATLLERCAPDVVVNCTGATRGGPEEMAATNVTGVFTLLSGVRVAAFGGRLVHLGSSAEYGRTAVGSSVPEDAPALPVGLYGVTKLAGTRLVEQASLGGVDAVALRVFNPIGAGAPETSLPGHLMAEVRRAAREAGAIELGPLDAVRDFVDARDVADAVLAAAVVPALAHPVVNVGSGRGVSARVLVDELCEIAGCTSEVTERSVGSERSAGVPWQQADVTRAAADLGWSPLHDLATSLKDWWRAP